MWEKETLVITSNFFFSHNVFKSCLLLIHQNEYSWSEGLMTFKRVLLNTLWEKEKVFVTIIFYFSHNFCKGILLGSLQMEM